jgi:hypothetical protein
MPITKLSQINKTYIQNMVTSLVSKKVYYNEAQLQFDLAWGIRQDITVSNLDVRLEELTATGTHCAKGKSKSISWYTDIVILDNAEKEFIPIELKYKTKAANGLTLKTHGAYDLGCYDFLWDTKRNEILKSILSASLTINNCNTKEFQMGSSLGKLINGFSIIVTNDSDYWKNKSGSKSCAKDFFLDDTRTISKNTPLQWGTSAKFYKDTWRDMDLKFDKDYNCQWFTINSSQYTAIKGLIFETI